jgi:hypothetical protein
VFVSDELQSLVEPLLLGPGPKLWDGYGPGCRAGVRCAGILSVLYTGIQLHGFRRLRVSWG